MHFFIVVFLLCSIITNVISSPDDLIFRGSSEEDLKFGRYWKEADRIVSLPEVDPLPSFPMYSGYLDATEEDHLFYWLVKSADPTSTSLILWFNGGPGCSSLDGFFYEHGPFQFDDHSGKLVENPDSWNKLANILYVESPLGTGFSYTTDPDKILNDDTAAETNLLALKDFFVKFPEFRSHYFYIAGESYAGIYIPLLARAIVRDSGEIRDNFQGIMIGNGLLDKELNYKTLIDYSYYHGLLSPVFYHEVKRLCNEDINDVDGEQGWRGIDEECIDKMGDMNRELYKKGLNLYNYAKDCVYSSAIGEEESHLYQRRPGYFGQNLEMVPTCSNGTLITKYLTREDVQDSLHARLEGNTTQWDLCSEEIFTNYRALYEDTSSVFKEIINEMPFLKVVLFFGDLDLACNMLGGEQFTDRLGYQITTPRRKWTVEKDGLEQMAGYYKEYDNLMYVTFKAAGHMVPTDKPKECFQMVRRILNDEPL